VQHTATRCNSLQHTATHCNTLKTFYVQQLLCVQHTVTYCNTLQHHATHRNTLPTHTKLTMCNNMYNTATHCNTLQHTATHYNTLQHTATHCQDTQNLLRATMSEKFLHKQEIHSLRAPRCQFSKISVVLKLLCKMMIQLTFANFHISQPLHTATFRDTWAALKHHLAQESFVCVGSVLQ